MLKWIFQKTSGDQQGVWLGIQSHETALNILWFPSDYSTFTSCYYCSQSSHQTENFLTTTLRKSVDLTTTLKGVYHLLVIAM